MGTLSRKLDQIRREINRRRRQYGVHRQSQKRIDEDFFQVDESEPSVYESDVGDSFHPLWKKEVFLMKILGAAILFFSISILYQSPNKNLEKVKIGIEEALSKEFQFAVVADWYEDTFGKPLALYPIVNQPQKQNVKEPTHYAMPANGKVLEPFSDDNQGIVIETGAGAKVEAISDGTVIFAGKRDDLGSTVIIQHPDYSESWYGNLEEISVKPREKVTGGNIVGTVSSGKSDDTGQFYFAIKQQNDFIDPIQVMKIE